MLHNQDDTGHFWGGEKDCNSVVFGVLAGKVDLIGHELHIKMMKVFESEVDYDEIRLQEMGAMNYENDVCYFLNLLYEKHQKRVECESI